MKTSRYAVLVVVLLLGPSFSVVAQEVDYNLFLFEKSYVSFKSSPKVTGAPAYYIPEPNLLAEAQPVRHIPLRKGFTTDMLFDGTSGGFRWNWYLSTQFRFRALDVPSLPIRSMSAIPRITFQFLRTSKGANNKMRGRRGVMAFSVVAGHHSNGGDGCVFVDEIFDAAGNCIPQNPAALDVRTQVKTEGGNFSTNYLEGGVYKRWGFVDNNGGKRFWPWSFDAGYALQYNHNVGLPIPGGAEPAFADLYGRVRHRFDLGGHRLVFNDNFAVRGWLSYELFSTETERYPGAADYRMEAELFLQGAWENGYWYHDVMNLVGLGVRYSRGQDYYNMQFVRNISFWQVILVIDAWSPRE